MPFSRKTSTKAVISVLAASAAAFPARVEVGSSAPNSTLKIKPDESLNATTPAGAAFAPPEDPAARLRTALVNNLASSVTAYIFALNSNGQLVSIDSNGKMKYPSTDSATSAPIDPSLISIPIGPKSRTEVTIPAYLRSCRVWLAEGELEFGLDGSKLVEPAAVNPSDPHAEINYSFAELTWCEEGGLWANPSAVDFVGLPVGINLTTTDDGPDQEVRGLPSDAVDKICTELTEKAEDGQPWDQECMKSSNGSFIRALAPNAIISGNGKAFNGFFEQYVDQVFEKYSTEPLTIDTQAIAGLVECKVDTGSKTMTCDNDTRSYQAPSTEDIFGCSSGPFEIKDSDCDIHKAVVPRLCAAFNRGTLLLGTTNNDTIDKYGAASGAIQPGLKSTSYYTNQQSMYNVYAASVHKHSKDGKGYAFSYDDVSPSKDEDVAGLVKSENPDVLTIVVGGYDLD